MELTKIFVSGIVDMITSFFGNESFLSTLFIAPFIFFIIRAICYVLNYILSSMYKRY